MEGTLPRWAFVTRALGACILWGSAFPAIRLAFRHLPPMDFQSRCSFAAWRFILAGIILLFLARASLGSLLHLPWRLFGVFCLCQILVTYILFYWGMGRCSGSLAAICMAAGSLWWLIAAPWFDRSQHVSRADFLPVLLGLGGVVLCLWDDTLQGDALGVGLILAAAFTSVCAMFFVRPLTQSHPLLLVNGASMLSGGLGLLACSGSAAWELPRAMDVTAAAITLWLSFISVIAFSLWYSLIGRETASRLSSWRLAEPIAGVLLSIVILHESMSGRALLGAAVTFAAIIICEQRKKARR